MSAQPLPEKFNNAFDIVTNCGTSEHVGNQFECWRNIHNCLKLNGFLLSAVPETGRYNEKHCDRFYDMNFFEIFADRLSFKTYLLPKILFPYNGGYIILAMEKTKESGFDFSEAELIRSCIK